MADDTPTATDRFTVRAVVVGLLVLALGIVAALLVVLIVVPLTAEQKTMVLQGLIGAGASAGGAVAALLAHTTSTPPAPVAPVAPAGAPTNIPVVDAPVIVADPHAQDPPIIEP